ncbi:MAG TPA: hypothetical protein VJS44_12760 [Pyrinomonadaceae bacterium]|nr:hypothetical protein [Pyrinomonadaceae bacterium]
MRVDVQRREWQPFLEGFGERNNTRPTRLQVINESGEVETDYWLEDGLTLAGTTLDKDGGGAPRIEIILNGGKSQDSRMTRTIAQVRRLGHEEDGERDIALEVEGKDGNVTILRFE